MVFNVATSFKDLMGPKDVKYSMMIADTVLVREGGNPDVLTAHSGSKVSSEYEDISYEIDEVPNGTSQAKNGKDALNKNDINAPIISRRNQKKQARRAAKQAMQASY